MQPHLLHVCIEILNQKDLPLLLGNRSLIKTKSTIKFGDRTLTIDWKNEKLCLPINLESSGHFHLQFHPMPQVEENRSTKDFVQKENWTKKETRKAVDYVAMEKDQSSQLGLEAEMEKSNDAEDVTILVDTTKASVPFNYDAHTNSGLVLQTGTEATSQVGRFDKINSS